MGLLEFSFHRLNKQYLIRHKHVLRGRNIPLVHRIPMETYLCNFG